MVDFREWLEKAYVFLEEAKDDISRERYWLACFHAQQFAELALKAVLVKLVGSFPFTHSLVELLEAIESLGYRVEEELYSTAEALEKHYTMARYPGARLVVYNRRTAIRCIEYAERIRRFVEKILEGEERGVREETKDV
ncbi:HEPN domain protein [Pyrolobus fumarii 1A]|uniref:HEPN domain protein n=1 Tax=Pyrolobus fumarii (strain DSM 11204 / 1A) TaxID=694429 RepID=G0EDE9_PYRF1|nr:HEPN domain-containing protein [Pyrolobus fumarii]AEM38634.1 HEPN domain protein [Pyrolobus fumarii 1A]